MSNPSSKSFISTLSALFLFASTATAEEELKIGFAPKFYAFENGLSGLDTEARITLLKELGYDGIGSARPNNVAERLEKYRAAGIDILSLYLGGVLAKDGSYTFDPAQSVAIKQLKGTGATIELYVRGSAKNTDAQAVAFVRDIADQAKTSDLKVVLYPHAGFYIDTLSDAVRIAKLSERDNVGAMFNLCHFLKVEPEADLRATLESAGDLLWRASTNGADSQGKNWNTLIQPLDKGTFDQTRLLRTLHELGFAGDIGLQCYAVKAAPSENLKRSLEAWRSHLKNSLAPE